jgi:hypothetical protein
MKIPDTLSYSTGRASFHSGRRPQVLSLFFEGVMILSNFGQVGGSSSNYSALSSLKAPGPMP